MSALRFLLSSLCMTSLLTLMGCANFGKQLKSFMAGDTPVESSGSSGSRGEGSRYSEQRDLNYDDSGRQYRRMTKKQFEEDARMEEQAGSLWIMEGQGSYLFSQNMVRLVGDILNVRLDGEPKKQLETKADVIRKIMQRAARPAPPRNVAGQPGPDGRVTEPKPGEAKVDDPNKKNDPAKDPNQQVAKKEDEESKDKDDDSALGVHMVPSRISEKLPDGSYRVRGSQIFMIGKNEYKVIVTGIVRSSDVTDEGIDSSKILDGRFDIVSLKKEIKL